MCDRIGIFVAGSPRRHRHRRRAGRRARRSLGRSSIGVTGLDDPRARARGRRASRASRRDEGRWTVTAERDVRDDLRRRGDRRRRAADPPDAATAPTSTRSTTATSEGSAMTAMQPAIVDSTTATPARRPHGGRTMTSRRRGPATASAAAGASSPARSSPTTSRRCGSSSCSCCSPSPGWRRCTRRAARSATPPTRRRRRPSIFLYLFTLSPERVPAFHEFLGILGPLLGIAFGFDAINGERAQGTLPRLVAQPIHRDEIINGKFVAGLARDRPRRSACLIAIVAGYGALAPRHRAVVGRRGAHHRASTSSAIDVHRLLAGAVAAGSRSSAAGRRPRRWRRSPSGSCSRCSPG